MGNQHADLARRIRDFKRYEQQQGRTPLIFVVDGAGIPTAPRDDTMDGWVVHATDSEAGAFIRESGRLCSRRHLCTKGIEFRYFGRKDLCEPEDYSDLINFAPLGHPAPELVVASKQHERFCSEADEYTPGIRIYFHILSLMALPAYVPFLGGHAVRGEVLLDEVRHSVLTASELDNHVPWTPKTFTMEADRHFRRRISNHGAQATR